VQDLGFVLSQVIDNLAAEVAIAIKEDGGQRKLHPTSLMTYIPDRHRAIITPAHEITLEGFSLKAQERGSAIQFMKSICKHPETRPEEITGPIFCKSIENLTQELNKTDE